MVFLGFYIYKVVNNYRETFGTFLTNDHDKWGQFGDYFGGMLNPVISLISLIVLAVVALIISRNEVEREKALLKSQRDIEYHVLLANIRHNQYPILLNEYILKLYESQTPKDFIKQLIELKKKKDRISFMFEWDLINDEFSELDRIRSLIDQQEYTLDKFSVFNENKEAIQSSVDRIKEFIQKSILSPIQNNEKK